MKCFREGILEVTVNTNNGVERKNKDFKYEFLSQHRNNTLSGMVAVLVETFSPEIHSGDILPRYTPVLSACNF